MKSEKSSNFQLFSLEELLETVNKDEQTIRTNQKYQKIQKMKAMQISKQQPSQKAKKLNHNQTKEKFAPDFDSPTILASKKIPNQNSDGQPLQKTMNIKKKEQKRQERKQQYVIYEEVKLKTKKELEEEQNFGDILIKVQFPQLKPKNYNKDIKDPKMGYSITFEQAFNYKNVNLSIRFGDYKIYQQKVKDRTILVVPFFDNTYVPYMLNDVTKRSNLNFQRIAAEQLDRKNESTFRTGEILSLDRLHYLPYDRVYFVRTAALGSLMQYNQQKLLQTFKRIVVKAEQDSAKSIVIGDWVWGKMQISVVSTIIYKGILEGINQLGKNKMLRQISLCVGKKHSYKAYSGAFRQFSDQYLQAFY